MSSAHGEQDLSVVAVQATVSKYPGEHSSAQAMHSEFDQKVPTPHTQDPDRLVHPMEPSLPTEQLTPMEPSAENPSAHVSSQDVPTAEFSVQEPEVTRAPISDGSPLQSFGPLRRANVPADVAVQVAKPRFEFDSS